MNWLLSLLLLGGCHTATWTAAAPTATPTFHTLTAEHLVELEYQTANGTTRQRIRGLIAILRPDRFRLRVLGPGGIALFDLLSLPEGVHIVQSIRNATDPRSRELFSSIAEDLRLAYDLRGHAPATTTLEANRVVARSDSRVVTLGHFVSQDSAALFTDLQIDNRTLHYQVHVKVSNLRVNPPLDPDMFNK